MTSVDTCKRPASSGSAGLLLSLALMRVSLVATPVSALVHSGTPAGIGPETYQAKGHDKGTTLSAWPSDDAIVAMGMKVLGMSGPVPPRAVPSASCLDSA